MVPGVTQPTSDDLVRAMSKNPADRFYNVREFIMALTAARSQLLVSQLRNQPGRMGDPAIQEAAEAGGDAPDAKFWKTLPSARLGDSINRTCRTSAQLSHCDWVCPKVPKFGFVQQANERTIPICKCAKI